MNRIGAKIALIASLAFCPSDSQKAGTTTAQLPSSELRPSPEMQRLLEAFSGNWKVKETFEIEASRQDQTRQGTASFRAGPGYSLIEDYKSTGSAGDLSFLALLWWDPKAQVYRVLTCANGDGCELRGTAKWEGRELVNSWEEEVDGKMATFKDSFVDISPSSFRLVSAGVANGKTIWRVITTYRRSATAKSRN